MLPPPPPPHIAPMPFLLVMFVTRAPLREPSAMNQFQALFESFLTIDGVPALTFCNEVRSPYLPVAGWRVVEVSPQLEGEGGVEIRGSHCSVNLICHKGNGREEMRRG